MNPHLSVEVPDSLKYALCPRCHGTTRRPYPTENDPTRQYASITAGYDKATDTLACDNCGGQTMSMHALGYVPKRPGTDEGCLHKFVGEKRGNCYHVYHCTHGCGAVYDIDSGD